MGAEQAIRRRAYPRKAEIARTLEAARDFGLDVRGFEVSPDGTIKILDARRSDGSVESEIERWKAEGRL